MRKKKKEKEKKKRQAVPAALCWSLRVLALVLELALELVRSVVQRLF
jgi:hypothetical protein